MTYLKRIYLITLIKVTSIKILTYILSYLYFCEVSLYFSEKFKLSKIDQNLKKFSVKFFERGWPLFLEKTSANKGEN